MTDYLGILSTPENKGVPHNRGGAAPSGTNFFFSGSCSSCSSSGRLLVVVVVVVFSTRSVEVVGGFCSSLLLLFSSSSHNFWPKTGRKLAILAGTRAPGPIFGQKQEENLRFKPGPRPRDQ